MLKQKEDQVVSLLLDCTEEGQKVTRNKGQKFLAVFRRIMDPYIKVIFATMLESTMLNQPLI